MSTTVEKVAESLAYSIVHGEVGFYQQCYENVLAELNKLLKAQRTELVREIEKLPTDYRSEAQGCIQDYKKEILAIINNTVKHE